MGVASDASRVDAEETLDERIRQLDSILTPLQQSARRVSDSISRLVSHRNMLAEHIEQKLDSAGLAATAIDSLAGVLRDGGANVEQRVSDRAEQTRMMIEKNDLQVVSMDRQIDQQIKGFKSAIAASADSLRRAARDLRRLHREIDYENGRILEHQRILYRPLVARDYYMRQVEWNRSVLMLAEAYLPALQSELIERRERIDAIAEGALLSDSARTALHTAMNELHSWITTMCQTLADTTARNQALGYVKLIKSDAFRYQSALDEARAAGWSIDPQVRDTVNAARENAEAAHAMLADFEARVRRQGEAYERVIADSAATVVRLTERRRVLEQKGTRLRGDLALLADFPGRMSPLPSAIEHRDQQQITTEKRRMERQWNRLVTEIRALQDSIRDVDDDTLHLRRDHERFVRQIDMLEAELQHLRTILGSIRSIRGYGWLSPGIEAAPVGRPFARASHRGPFISAVAKRCG